MKAIYLPYALEVIVRAFSYIAVVVLDIVHFILKPFTWLQFKAHAFIVAASAVGYLYLKLYVNHNNALLIAAAGLVAAVSAIALIKLARKQLNRIRQTLMRTYYSPVGIFIYVPSALVRFLGKFQRPTAKCGGFN